VRIPLKVAILESGVSQREVSLDARVGETRLSQIVCDRVEPTPQEQLAIARVLGRPVEQLFTAQG
jgi:transcriptional regulator with XRE-family HTH domain